MDAEMAGDAALLIVEAGVIPIDDDGRTIHSLLMRYRMALASIKNLSECIASLLNMLIWEKINEG
ncbi:hypothetical protein HH1059_19650 [Halorhodospira halochloris]|uniref:Uncharacterized protein n=1 Tax=Halorhodospira halochloris TaxID=1052 RepID=A0A2Z6EZP9_HALHR|nr:hypothetical protein HH1059_19650 [Halorhodospira halochloris]